MSKRRPALESLLALCFLATCKKEPPAPPPPTPPPAPAVPEAQPQAQLDGKLLLQFFTPLPQRFENPKNPITPEKVALGRMLFYETRLSKNHDVSCNSCHALDGYGVDGQPTSTGHRGKKGGRSAPTVYNAGGHVAQFWDGRAADLEAQAKGPILNPIEMAMPNERKVVAVLKSIPGYVAAFKAAFPADKDAVTYDNLARAVGAFERELVTPSGFDMFLAGDRTALTSVQQEGLATFVSLGCNTCHNGPAVGGASFQKLGLVKPFDTKDVGRFEVTKDEADRFKFRVPSLRNIEMTGPYMHDGAKKTLEEMVQVMAEHQLGKTPTEVQVRAVVAFLKSLTGTLRPEQIAKPELPPSGPKTPKPDPT